jgi:beta-barrel assembly-enhancing protease
MSRARIALAVSLVVLAGCGGMEGMDLSGLNIAGIPVGGIVQTTSLVAGSTVDMEEAEEIELGRATSAIIGSRYPLLRDEALTRYVALVGNTVALKSERPDMRYYFGILDSDDINAVAAAGGYIFVTRGALALMRDEAMLAGVLGHEIGHITLRHHDATIKQSKRKAAAVSGLQAGASFTSAGQFNQLIGLGADALGDLALKGFSQKEEGASDVVGFKYAAAAGYDPAGLRDFLKTLQTRGTQPAIKQFVSTHPGVDDRLKEQEKLLGQAPAGGRRNQARFEQAMARLQKR